MTTDGPKFLLCNAQATQNLSRQGESDCLCIRNGGGKEHFQKVAECLVIQSVTRHDMLLGFLPGSMHVLFPYLVHLAPGAKSSHALFQFPLPGDLIRYFTSCPKFVIFRPTPPCCLPRERRSRFSSDVFLLRHFIICFCCSPGWPSLSDRW